MCFFVTEKQVGQVIGKGELITKRIALWILKKAISIHNYFISIVTDDPAITCDDEVHQEWIATNELRCGNSPVVYGKP